MITRQQAYERISGLAEAEVRQLCGRRILGEDTAPVGGGYFDEPPEDLVIQLLRNRDLPNETREALIGGCKDVYSQALAWVATVGASESHSDLEPAITRLCRVVDVAEPTELGGHADAMLSLALSAQGLPSDVLCASVRASMAFGSAPDHVPLWERALARPEVAAYAFNALLEIDPHHDRIHTALVDLWLRQLRERWNVDTPYLMRRAARKRDSGQIIGEVLDTVAHELTLVPDGKALWDAVCCELQRHDWSRNWTELLPAGERRRAMAPLRRDAEEVVAAADAAARLAAGDFGMADLGMAMGPLRRDVEEELAAADAPARVAAGDRRRALVPRWDRDRLELRLGDVVVKQFKVPAANQGQILAAFEEEGWPVHIDDPLSPHPEQDPKRRLHATINALNRNQKNRLIRFRGDGSGQGVRWELIEPDSSASFQ